MRKSQLEKINSYLKIFEKLHEAIVLNLESETVDINVLGECVQTAQNIAVEMGTLIEECEGLGHITVSHLEEYCEVVYSIFEAAQEAACISAVEAKTKLETSLDIIRNSVQSDIKIKKLIVFLPYKVSMWDSLETIWKAANEDPACEALVIPIPYYKKNPNGDPIEMIYEGDLYPDTVPIVNYKEFEYEKERPDVIYVHNPYDDGNTLTSVLPFFYSENLKKFTDCLVYVPYYATSGGSGEHMAYLNSYMIFDYIVIQSEAAKVHFHPVVPREKLLPLGSPKFDSVIQKCRNPKEIPAEWQEKIEGKKVYFYNTSIAGALHKTSFYWDKMEYVFDTFKRHPEVCLIWRPHPLLETTLDGMRPEYKARYERIRDKYIEEDFGIYDTTPSIEDTIALCDVYVGDSGTSVTSLFGVSGKALFILNNDINAVPSKEDIGVLGFYLPRIDHKINYTVLPGKNHLYKRNPEGVFEFFAEIDEWTQGYRYQGAVDYKDKIFVIPRASNRIVIFDKSGNKKEIVITEMEEFYTLFSEYFKVDNKVVIFPYRSSKLIILDMDEESIATVDGIGNYNVAVTEYREYVPAARFYRNQVVYILDALGNEMIGVDLKNNSINRINVQFNQLMFAANPEEQGSRFWWFYPETGTVAVRYNMDTNEYQKYDLAVEGLLSFDRKYFALWNRRYFNSCVKKGNKVIFAPYWGNKFVELDLTTGKCSEFKTQFDCGFEDVNSYNINLGIGSFIHSYETKKMQYVSLKEKQTYDVDVDTMTFTKHPEKFNVEDFVEHEPGFSKLSPRLQYCCQETVINSLEDLINGTIHGSQNSIEDTIKAFEAINASPDGDCGEKIHRTIMECL